ncbi:MAG: hypothetical protein U0V72_09965 [Cytophagales bacterium]
MSKLKNVIRQLSDADYQEIFNSLMDSGAEKSAHLLKYFKEKQLNDTKIMDALDLNTSAYYTMRSRLNQKIEEYLLQQMENPRTDLVKKTASIHDVIFSKNRSLSITTLKKFEKELQSYDLSNELTFVYKLLKKMHAHTPEGYHYKQMYNKHVAYMLALDKAEDLITEYFRKYGEFFVSSDNNRKLELEYSLKELINVSKLYQSHRLYVYQSLVNIFHLIHVDDRFSISESDETIDEIFVKLDKIFEEFYLDTFYFNIKIVFEYLKLEYYSKYKLFKNVEKYHDEINSVLPKFLECYSLFTFPYRILLTKLERNLRLFYERSLYDESRVLLDAIYLDKDDKPSFIIYHSYRALTCYYVDKYTEALEWIDKLIENVVFKYYQEALVQVKLLQILLYALNKDKKGFEQAFGSIKRIINVDNEDKETDAVTSYILAYLKMLRYSFSENNKLKSQKMKEFMQKIVLPEEGFCILNYIRLDERLLQKLM